MSSNSEHKYQMKKRRRLIIQEDESSDESVIVRSHRKKKLHRIIVDGESSDEESDVPKPVVRRRNYRVISEDDASDGSSTSEVHRSIQFGSSDSSEWQSDWTSSDELNNDVDKNDTSSSTKPVSEAKTEETIKTNAPSPSVAETDSDNSDEQVEKCPICLLPFKKQELATPSSCEHCFCLECLIEWSKNINTCPVDRQTFTVIHVKRKVDGKVLRHLPVEVISRIDEPVQEDPTFCEVCHQCDREDRMLLCDRCDSGYHLECLTPPMNEVPMEEWFCPLCSQYVGSVEDSDELLAEISDLMEEARLLGVSYGRIGYNQVLPRIPRTRQTERVRANICNRARQMQANRARASEEIFDPNQPSTSSGLGSVGDNSRSRSPVNPRSRSTSRSKVTKRKTKRRAKPSSRKGTYFREVRITEYNNDGEEEEIVTYVKVAPTKSRRKSKKRTKKTRKVYC